MGISSCMDASCYVQHHCRARPCPPATSPGTTAPGLQNGHRSSVQPKAAQLVLPGWPYTAADLERFSAAGREVDMSLLELVWSIAVDEPSTALSLEELAQLVFDDSAPLALYSTYVMLAADRLYFQQASKVGEAWPAGQQGG
jgi:hypothetical protein